MIPSAKIIPISIHALREEGDLHWHMGHKRTLQFLSTPSARRATVNPRPIPAYQVAFLSTPSARRATWNILGNNAAIQISIHALREEGDAPTLIRPDQ